MPISSGWSLTTVNDRTTLTPTPEPMKHIIIPIGIAAAIMSALVITGQGNIDAGTFTYDPRDDMPANAQQKAP